MTKRVAGKCVQRKEGDVYGKDERAYADTKAASEEEGADRVVPKENDEKHGEIEKIAMDILKDEGKRSFATIIAPRRLGNRTGGRVQEKRPVVSFAVVVARGAKAQGASKDQ